jgi:catechol 2,3-dioxygenase-like lactoylglutathione lyase family enzyme
LNAFEAVADPAPLTGRVPSQLGIVVADIEAAKRTFGQLLGCGWATLRDGRAPVPYRGADGTVEGFHLKVAESLQGPPYLELLEAIEASVWEPAGDSYLHHVAYEVEDLEAAGAELERQGYRLLLTQPSEETRLKTFGLYRRGDGIRVEVVDAAVIGARREREAARR